MRRLSVSIAVAMLLVSATMAAYATSPGYYKDEFKAISFSGNDGTLEWSGPWNEWNESDGAESGYVSVTGNPACPDGLCLELATPLLGSVGAVRWADVSRYTEAEVSFQVAGVKLLPLVDGDADLCLEISFDGEKWTKVHTEALDGLVGKNPYHFAHVIHTEGAQQMAVRFSVAGIVGYQALVDSVKVREKGDSTTTTVPETTTTTKVKPSSTTTSVPVTTTTTPVQSTTTAPRPTSTTEPERFVTTTTVPPAPPGAGEEGGGTSGTGRGTPGSMRYSASGVQAGFTASIYGDSDVYMPVGLEADYRIAVEMVESSALWLVSLGVVIAAALASIVRRRRGSSGDPAPN